MPKDEPVFKVAWLNSRGGYVAHAFVSRSKGGIGRRIEQMLLTDLGETDKLVIERGQDEEDKKTDGDDGTLPLIIQAVYDGEIVKEQGCLARKEDSGFRAVDDIEFEGPAVAEEHLKGRPDIDAELRILDGASGQLILASKATTFLGKKPQRMARGDVLRFVVGEGSQIVGFE